MRTNLKSNKYLRSKRSRILEKIETRNLGLLTKVLTKVSCRRFHSYSAYGEDAVVHGILLRYKFIFKKSLEVSYLDIGAWKPIQDSNTYFLYKLGKQGTAIEPNPNLVNQWRAVRPLDYFVNVGCSRNSVEKMSFFHKLASSNTLSSDFAISIESSQGYKVEATKEVPCMTLEKIVANHIEKFDLPYILDIDVEGMDFEVIQTFDFRFNRPVILIIEDMSKNNSTLNESLIHGFLTEKHFGLFARTAISSIYLDLNHELATVASRIL